MFNHYSLDHFLSVNLHEFASSYDPLQSAKTVFARHHWKLFHIDVAELVQGRGQAFILGDINDVTVGQISSVYQAVKLIVIDELFYILEGDDPLEVVILVGCVEIIAMTSESVL